MNFQLVTTSAVTSATDLLIIPVFGDPSKDGLVKQLNTQLGGALLESVTAERFEGKLSQTLTLHTGGKLLAKRVMLVGAGTKADLAPGTVRDLAALAAANAGRLGAVSLVMLSPTTGAKAAHAVQLLVEGALGGCYRFARYLTSEDAKRPLSVKSFGILLDAKGGKLNASQTKSLTATIERATSIARAVNNARDLINEPAEAIYPASLAAHAEAAAKKSGKLTVTVLGAKKCEELGMGMFLAVGRGSERESKLIHIVYTPAKKAKKKVALIGKGVTFDSGGYSLKPSDSMMGMKVDMSGAAAVISAMTALAELGCEHEVHAIAACCENLVSGRAYKLGDVLTAMDGTTVEINNTDAEGRLTLGDAIAYARKVVAPDEMFDFATLTGACMVALGPHTAGVLSDHESLCKSWLAAADRSGEDMWRLPLRARLREQLKSPIADMRNTGERWGGALTAGLFLKSFAKDTPWVHVDIAGPADTTAGRPHQPKGGTGFGIATIVEYLVPAK